jgi:hypothetical protein
MPGLIAAAVLVLGQTQPIPSAQSLPGEFDIGESSVEGWEVRAWTDVDRSETPPVIRDIVCQIEKDGLELSISHYGGSRFVLTDWDEHDAHDARRIAFDDAVWEYHWRPWDPASVQFADVPYPPPPPPPDETCGLGGHNLILYGCTHVEAGARLVRRTAEEPWMWLDSLTNELMRAHRMRIGYRPADGEEGEMTWKEVPLAGLDQAIAWCRANMATDAARTLRPHL